MNQQLKHLSEILRDLVEDSEKHLVNEFNTGLIGAIAEDLNTEQLSEGLRSNGSILPEYSDVSVEVYGKEPGPMTIKDTGDFYKSIEVKANSNQIELISTDEKMKAPVRLDWNYGPLLGLTNRNIKKITDEEVSHLVQTYIQNKFNEI